MPDRAHRPSAPGVGDAVAACLFDLDGVVTKTALVHARAWKQIFDECLRERAERTGAPFVAFDAGAGYNEYVDGRPRYDALPESLLAVRPSA